MKKYLFLLLFPLTLATLTACTTPAVVTHDVLIVDTNVVDVNTGQISKHQTIAIDNGKITSIAPTSGLSHHRTETLIDAGDQYVIPGLWDMHIHIEGEDLVPDNENLLQVYVAYGITTVRDAASDLGRTVLEWRDEINQGKRFGPQIYTAGLKLEGINSIWKGDLEIANDADLNAALDLLDSWQVDFVKITDNTLPPALFLASIEAAHTRGYLVSSHVPYGASIQSLADAGLSSIEHASYVLRLGSDEDLIIAELDKGGINKAEATERYVRNFDQQKAFKRYQKLAAEQVAVTPTLIGGRQLAYLNQTDHSADPFLKYLSDRFVSKYDWRIGRMEGETEEQTIARQETYALVAAQLPYLQKAGVLLLAGSDSAALNTYVYPALGLHEELVLWQDAGMQPLQILQAATINGARFFGVEGQTGSISAGKEADLVLLNSNPLINIQATQDINSVILNGEVYDRQALDAMLDESADEKLELDASRAQNNSAQ